MEGFFPASVLQGKPPVSRVPKCGACRLFKTCKSPKMEVTGKGERKILLLGEAPGKTEDLEGRQFCGETGTLLEKTLKRLEINMRRDCWMTNSLICFPWEIKDGKKKHRAPTEKEIEYCRPNLVNTIEDLKPEIIIPLGDVAVKSLIGWLWKDNPGPIYKWIGWQIPHIELNTWICPTWHPSYVSREGYQSYGTGRKNQVVIDIWEDHLRKAGQISCRPWNKKPPYEEQIQLIHSPEEAAKIIREMIPKNEVAAFDYETNMLKPDWPDARILCASICFDTWSTIAFPWVGEVREAMREFLQSPIKKIASNLKFEERWSSVHAGTRVNNWWWDTMLGAHIHDNRPEITGLKFQSFVRLGVDSYDDHIKPFKKSKGDERTNQLIKNVDLNDLLHYCALDSLFEYHVAFKQRKAMGFPDE